MIDFEWLSVNKYNGEQEGTVYTRRYFRSQNEFRLLYSLYSGLAHGREMASPGGSYRVGTMAGL